MKIKIDFIIVSDEVNELVNNQIKSINKQKGEFIHNVIVVPFGDGYNEALNRGYLQSTANIVFFCNNDLIWDSNALINLVAALNYYDSVSPWCPKTHRQWWKDNTPVGPYETGHETGKKVAGWCIGMWRDTWIKIGGFDERLKFWCCDNSYSEQLKANNLKHALVKNAEVLHLQSESLNKLPKNKYNELTKKQVKIFNRLYNKNLFNLGV